MNNKIHGILLAGLVGFTSTLAHGQSMTSKSAATEMLKEHMALMSPELKSKVNALSPKTKKILMKLMGTHDRYSDQATMRFVMIEILNDFQSVLAGIMMDNPEQVVDSATRIANHRIPRGGLLPYLGLKNINDDKLAVLDTFNDLVELNAMKIAEAAKSGDMQTAASLVGSVSAGCVGCHQVFRDKPGVSPYLKK